MKYQAMNWTPSMRYDLTGFGGDAFRYNPSADVSGADPYTLTPEFQQYAAQQGIQQVQWNGPDGVPHYGLMGKDGQIIPGTESRMFTDDSDFFTAAVLGIGGAGALAAAGAGAAGGAAGSGIGQGAMAGGVQGGTLGATGGLTAGQAAAIGGGAATLGSGGGSMAGDAVTVGGQSNPYGDYNLGTKTAGNSSTSLADFFSGKGSASDYGRAAQTLWGLYQGNKATDAAAGGQAAANALMREMWQASQAENKPLVDMRNNTILPKLNALLSNPSSITQDPGYQFGLDEMRRQRENAFAGRGGYYSGAQLRRADRDAIDYSGTKLNESINRLIAPANLTQIGSNNNQQANNALAGGLGNGLAQMGNIRGSGYMGQANTVNNAMNNWFADQWFKQGGG